MIHIDEKLFYNMKAIFRHLLY